MSRGLCIPRSGDWITLENPDESKDYVCDNQKYYGSLNRPNKIFLDRNTKQEKADGNLSKHQGLKSLDPFPIGVLHELDELPFRQIGLVSSKTIVYFNDDETGADDDSKRGAYDSVVIPAYTSDDPDSGG